MKYSARWYTWYSSGLNYSKEVCPCQLKEQNKFSLGSLQKGVCWLVSTLVQGMESCNGITGLICALHYLYRLLLSALQLGRSYHSYTGAGSLLLYWTASAMPFPHSWVTSSSKWETTVAKTPSIVSRWKIPWKIHYGDLHLVPGLLLGPLLPLPACLTAAWPFEPLRSHSSKQILFQHVLSTQFWSRDLLLHLFWNHECRGPTHLAWILTDHLAGEEFNSHLCMGALFETLCFVTNISFNFF